MNKLLPILLLIITMTSCNKTDITPYSNPCNNPCGRVVDKDNDYIYIDNQLEQIYYIYVQKTDCGFAHQIQVSPTDYFTTGIDDWHCNY